MIEVWLATITTWAWTEYLLYLCRKILLAQWNNPHTPPYKKAEIAVRLRHRLGWLK